MSSVIGAGSRWRLGRGEGMGRLFEVGNRALGGGRGLYWSKGMLSNPWVISVKESEAQGI